MTRTHTASVFKATDLETGLDVALKIPHLEAESDLVFFERFRREALIGRELNHPAVARVLPKIEQSQVYIAMEWVGGHTLREILEQQGKLPEQRAVGIAIQLCRALDYIHEQGVIHRDLKPENIFVGADDSVKLIDFGIAARRGSRRVTFGHLSTIMGTPDYISPEQIRGRRGNAQSDIFALGVILFEMLTGEVPFQGSTPIAVIHDRLVNDPFSLRTVNSEIEPVLKPIIRRAMEREPKRRYKTALQMAGQLEHPELSNEAAETGAYETLPKRVMVCSGLAMVPTFILLLLLYVAHQQ